jgi:hypothetical protein
LLPVPLLLLLQAQRPLLSLLLLLLLLLYLLVAEDDVRPYDAQELQGMCVSRGIAWALLWIL